MNYFETLFYDTLLFLEWFYEKYSQLFIIIGFVLSIALLTTAGWWGTKLARLIRNYKSKPKKGDLILFNNSAQFISYVARRNGRYVSQKWVLDRKKMRSDRKRKKFIPQFNKIVDERNKEGEEDWGGTYKFGARITYRLRGEFRLSDYIRYDELMRKMSFSWRGDDFPGMLPSEWDLARRTTSHYTGIEELTDEEKLELDKLIEQKNELSQRKHKRFTILGPYDVFYKTARQAEKSSKKSNKDVYFESDLEKLKPSKLSSTPTEEHNLSDNGIYVGGGYYYPEQGNFLTIGGTRSGKGTNLIIPQLLSTENYKGSTVVIDIKGENAAIAAAHLKKSGKEVFILDPWNIQEKIGATHGIESSSLNPLDILKEVGDETHDECTMIAEMLVPYNSGTNDRHFEDRARQIVTAYLKQMVTSSKYGDRISMDTLCYLLSLPDEDANGEDMSTFLSEMFVNEALNGSLKQTANQIKNMWSRGEREMQSIMSTVDKNMDIFKSPALQRSLSHSDFDIQNLTDGNMVLFLCIPSNKLKSHSVWLRLIVSTIISTIQKKKDKPVLLLLDEFYSLGYMPLVEQAMGYMTGFDLRIWAIVQNLSQLKEYYTKNWETFIANSAVSTWLGTNDNTTSEYLSRLMGDRTVKYQSTQSMVSEIKGGSPSTSENFKLTMQSPLEIRENDGIYTLVKGTQPINFPKMPYFEDERFSTRASKNPYLNE